jgi:hypothetical protein
MQIDWGTNIVFPECIDEILNLFNMETIRTVFVAWKRLEQESIVLTLDEWNHKNDFLSILYTMICWSKHVRCSKRLRAFIWWSLDNSKIFLCTFEELRIYSVCRSDKWFIAMCYIGFVTYTVIFNLNFRLFVLS